MANLVIGLYNPFKYGIREFEGYDITKFRDNIRFMEIIEDRNYGSNGQICPLYFDGATSTFMELPKPKDTKEINKVYEYIENRNNHIAPMFFMPFIKFINKFKK